MVGFGSFCVFFSFCSHFIPSTYTFELIQERKPIDFLLCGVWPPFRCTCLGISYCCAVASAFQFFPYLIFSDVIFSHFFSLMFRFVTRSFQPVIFGKILALSLISPHQLSTPQSPFFDSTQQWFRAGKIICSMHFMHLVCLILAFRCIPRPSSFSSDGYFGFFVVAVLIKNESFVSIFFNGRHGGGWFFRRLEGYLSSSLLSSHLN